MHAHGDSGMGGETVHERGIGMLVGIFDDPVPVAYGLMVMEPEREADFRLLR